MQYAQQETERDVTLVPGVRPVGTVIVLHGLGADGWDFVPVAEHLRLPATLPLRFVFPHAPVRPVTVNNGYEMRAWYDIRDFSLTGREDLEGITQATDRVNDYVRAEAAHGIGADRIVLAGFSQGGAVALHAGIRHAEPLAGIVALSTYLPFKARLGAEISQTNREVPILMCHGTQDPVVSVELGQMSRDVLKDHGYEVEWHAYPMGHEVGLDEIARVSTWLQGVLA
ncbi:MAG: dienelactone hydrolase family protein [Steroidobacteraceae bacterium]|nr:dienelactone hydrolase family protein [Steroidobacteraceae bacterium]